MTESTLILCLRITGWASILAVGMQFLISMVIRNAQMTDLDMDAATHSVTYAIYTIGFFLELPLATTLACLCLMAARFLTFKQQTLKSVFE